MEIDQAEVRFREGSETKIDKSQNLTVLITESKFKEGSRTKIDKSLDLIDLKIFFVFTSLYFSILVAEEFRSIIENRWDELRSKPSNPEQAWFIPQPSRNSWGDTRDLNKVSCVSQTGYNPRVTIRRMKNVWTNISERFRNLKIVNS